MSEEMASLKVAFYVGDLPTTTFINRLATGLAKTGVEVRMYGLIKKRFSKLTGVSISGPTDGYKEGRISRFFRYLKYAVMLSLLRAKDKRKIDTWLVSEKKTHWGEKSLLYPILWDKPDILHLQWVKAVNHFAWTNLFGIKLVVSLRGAHINYSPITVPGLANKYQKYFPLVDGFHGVSKAICLEANKYGADLKKCEVVYSGFPIEEFSISDFVNEFETLKERPVKIISVGRSHWKKGYHFALDAMQLLSKKGIDFSYTIIGAVGNEELSFQKSQLELNDAVEFLDNVPFEKVKQKIREADVLLLPSVEEGVANVVLEAMLLGTVVLSTNCGGMEEVITNHENGYMVPIRNPKAIAQAIIDIKNQSPHTLNKMVENAYQKVVSQHSEDKMVRDMTGLYQTVLKNKTKDSE